MHKYSLLALVAFCAVPVVAAQAAPVLTQFHHGPDHTGVFEGANPGNMIKTLWTYDDGGYTISSPIVADGVLYIGTKTGNLDAVDAASGKRLWRFQADDGITATPAVANGVVYFQSATNTVYAVDAKRGQVVWRRATGATVIYHSMMEGFPEGTNWDYWTSSPLYADDTIYIGSGDSNVYALGARDGHVKWTFKTGNRVRATPATEGNRIYVGSFDGYMYALDPKSGKLDWSFKTKGNQYFKIGAIQGAAAVSDGVVVFGSRDFNEYALDARTGKELWEDLHKDSWAGPTAPAILDGKAYVPSSDAHFIRCNDLRTGKTYWTAPTDSNVFSAPAIAGDSLYAGTFGGTFARIKLADAKTGGLILQERIYTSPWLEGSVAYFATSDGIVYAVTNGTMPKS